MRPVRNRNTKRNAHPSRHRHCRRCRFRRHHALTLAALRTRHYASDSSVDGWLLCRLSPLACCVVLHPSNSCFQEFIFWTKKTFLPGFLRIPFFLCFSEEFFTGTWFWRGRRNSCFFSAVTGISRRNSCGTGIPVFTPESSRFRRFPEDSCSRQKLLALASD